MKVGDEIEIEGKRYQICDRGNGHFLNRINEISELQKFIDSFENTLEINVQSPLLAEKKAGIKIGACKLADYLRTHPNVCPACYEAAKEWCIK